MLKGEDSLISYLIRQSGNQASIAILANFQRLAQGTAEMQALGFLFWRAYHEKNKSNGKK